MKKLELNKQTVSQLDKAEMSGINGGQLCLISCASGTRKGKDCCYNDIELGPPIA